MAEEHLRPATAEEMGEIFSTRIARDDLERLLELDPDDPETYELPDTEPVADDDPQQAMSPVLEEDFDLDPEEDWSSSMTSKVEMGETTTTPPPKAVTMIERGEKIPRHILE